MPGTLKPSPKHIIGHMGEYTQTQFFFWNWKWFQATALPEMPEKQQLRLASMAGSGSPHSAAAS